jgi:putative transposase
MKVSRSGFYAWVRREPSARDLADKELLTKIRRVHKASKQTYGAPRVHAELAAEGIHVGRKRVERLMRTDGLVGVSRRRGTRTTIRDDRVRPASDLVDRNFYAGQPDELWVADMTYVPTWTGFLYLAVVLDAFSRRPSGPCGARNAPLARFVRASPDRSASVGWAMGTNLRTQLVLDALNMAVGQRRPSGVIHHSDQGSQYTSIAFGLRCKEAGVRPSMGSVGDAYDNAMCESFFATLECELLDRRKFQTKAEARMAIFEFIEGWYNPGRRHSALGYLSPIDYERRALAGLETSSP